MENEILQQILDTQKQILNKVDTLETTVGRLEQGQAETNSRLDRVEQKVTKIEVTLENETNRNINLLVEGHKGVVERLDELKDISKKVLQLQNSDTVQNVAIKELSRRTAANK